MLSHHCFAFSDAELLTLRLWEPDLETRGASKDTWDHLLGNNSSVMGAAVDLARVRELGPQRAHVSTKLRTY